ncbi:hypothetical protein MACK_004046 [Theileria orientalis]|uniref:Protein SEY1 homolog n=1 Tax=Theileria orientalis TaxID=68886 RepID=A0A976XK29_THEOR|nr:hypothetical protein MACK_004046 [Theileria orientalis]
MESYSNDSHETNFLTSLSPVEFTNYECEINDGFNKYLKDGGFDTYGFNFNVLTILGSQSSGKSHLLNTLFSSKFQTMDSSKGHSQTTKGIWASLLLPKQRSGNAVVVFDSEGTDSRERGEGRLTFEHRSSLFCLALSDVVVVNLWYNSLGNLTSSNYGLLKTVVEANLELVDTNNDQSFKTLLFFCVRDWSPNLSPLNVVKDYVMNKYMSSIWNEITKPARFANVGVESLFEIRVFGLSNAITDTVKFNENLEEVRRAWNELRPSKYSRLVPSDGFFVYCNNVWNTIIEQNHLDIPTQKEMLSSYRCAEIKSAVLQKVTSCLKDQNEGEFMGYVSNLLKEAEELYFTEASRYDASVSKKVANELLSQLCGKLQPYFESALGDYVKKLTEEASTLLEKEFGLSREGKNLKVGGLDPHEAWPKFTDKCQELQRTQSDKLEAHLEGFRVSHHNNVQFSYEFDTQSLKEHFKLGVLSEFDVTRSRQLELLKQQVGSIADSCFVLLKSSLMERGLKDDEFWTYFEELFDETHKNCLNTYSSSYKGLLSEVAENEFEYLSLVLLLSRARHNFEKLQSNLEELVVDRFDRFFNYQEFKGELVPTEWHKQSDQELNNKYKQSKEDALYLLQVFKKTKTRSLPTFSLDSVKKNHYFYRTLEEKVKENYSNVLSEKAQLETTDSCAKRFMEMYKNAQVVQNAGTAMNSWRNIPPVFWLILLVLGWNEIRSVLRVVFKFQLLIPLLFVIYFGVNYVATTFLGPSAEQYVKMVRQRLLSLLKYSIAWTIRTLNRLNSKRAAQKKE